MKKLFTFCLLAVTMCVAAQQKVAVYVTGPEAVDETILPILGSELVAGIVSNPNYVAVERTTEFLDELSKEQGYQRSGNVNDGQISQLGQQFGVDLVCVATIMPFKESFYINARLIDVVNASVIATARETSTLTSLDDFVNAAEKLSSKLVGKQALEQQALQEILPEKYSQIRTQSADDIYLIAIDNTGQYTEFTFKFVSLKATRINCSLDAYVIDEDTQIKYTFIGASGIGTGDNWVNTNPGITMFTITTSKLPETTTHISIYESKDWHWDNITLIPFGKKNYFRFDDNTEILYQQMVAKTLTEEQKQKDQQAQINQSVEQLGDAVVDLVSTLTTYNLVISNNHTSPRKVVVDGHYVGDVPGNSVSTIKVPRDYYHKIVLIQKSGYIFSPNQETFTLRSRPAAGETFTIKN